MDVKYELLQFYAYKKIIKRRDIKAIYEECNRLNLPVESFMQAKAYCTEVEALPALGDFYGLPYVEVDMLDINRELVDRFPYPFLKRHKFLPVSINRQGVLLVAIGHPLDMHARSALATQFSCDMDFVLVPPTQIDIFVDSIVAVISTTKALNDLQDVGDKDRVKKVLVGSNSDIESSDDVINNPAVRLVDSIIREAIPFKASDIHIEPAEETVKVRYRIDGDLQLRVEFPIESYSAICARLKIISGINIAERRIPQDGRIGMMINGVEYDFRVSTLPTIYGEKFVIRILDKTSFNFTRSELGFTEEENVVVDKILANAYGIVLLTGPTGSGKTTTLYSFLKEINNPTVNVITVEDPVEYTLAGVNQIQVNPKANLTFASTLRSILRQDPDIIMIGEIRDEDTAEIAVRAAITGHLVFSTLHTSDAPGAIIRLEDMGVTDYLVADALVGVISQRLVKKLCPACKKRSKTNEAEVRLLGLSEPTYIYRPQGCQFCNHTGYKGRIAVHEIMHVNDKLRAATVAHRGLEDIRRLAEESGMVTLWENCKRLVLKGVTDIGELMSLYTE